MKTRRYGSRALLLASTVLGLASCGGGDDSASDSFNVPNSVAIADVNGDGVPDLAVATTSVVGDGSGVNPGFAAIYLQTANGGGTSFQAGKHYDTGDSPSSIATGDLTGTGTVDLVVTNFAAGTVSVLLETAANSGQYQAAMNITVGGRPNDVVIGDLNGDGKQDIIVADESTSGRVVVLLQDPSSAGHFGAPVALSTVNAAFSVTVGDINGDGKVDIVAATSDANGNNGSAVVFYQDPATVGSFLTPVTFAGGAQPASVKIADLNGDGLPDLAIADNGPGTDGTGSSGATVLMQSATTPGTFLAPVTYATQLGGIHIVVADLNGDSKPDLVVANLGPSPGGSVSVLLQDPARPGIFQAATSYAGFGQPLAVAVGDLNNDGRPDIVVADGDTASVLIQSATAAGTFAGAVQVGS